MGAFRLVRVGSPYNGSELADLDFEQSADTMYLAHLNHAPAKLERSSHTEWVFSDISFSPDIAAPAGVSAAATVPNTDAANTGDAYFPQAAAYVVTAIDDETGQESRASSSSSATNDLTLKRNFNTITWSAVTGADRYRIYKADNQQNYGYIGNTDQLTFRDDNIQPDLSDGPPIGQNPFAAAGDYPSAVAFFEQRLMFARTSNHPNAVWGSKSGDYENFDIRRPLQADDSLSFAVVGGRVSAANHLVPVDDLLVLASDSIFKVNGGGNNDYLTASQIVSRRQIGRGSSRLKPLLIDSVTFYKPSVGNDIRTIGYTFEIDGYKSDNMSIFSPHLFRGFNIVSWAYAQEPRSAIWAVRDDGKALCFTWEQEQQVWGWTLCETDGLFKSVCVVSEGGEDRPYFTVQRTINGSPRIYIERMAAATWDGIEDACYLDCAKTYAFTTPQTALVGLDHLEGEAVVALADGNIVEDLVVTDGAVALPNAASDVTIGLPYDALVETLPLAIQTKAGWTIARRSTVGELVIRVIDTRGLEAGPDEGHLFPIKPRQDERYGDPNALKTGDYVVDPRATSGDGGSKVVVKGTPGLPFTITTIAYDPHIGG